MGMGPVYAIEKILHRSGVQLQDIEILEINEAFAAQAIACIEDLKVDHDRVNVRGGSLAIGHPLGASGVRISTTLIHAMRDHQARLGLAAMCIGLGQGIAVIFESME
ncbi:MAG: acetyl-CoA C-acyltransferase, partial [Pirellulales bacterium]|nr:acetyl-CoA C-acyltransferase [Pirellulales bacterium]